MTATLYPAMKAKYIPRMIAVGFLLTTGSIPASQELPPQSETEQLRGRVTRLEERIKQLEALLKAKEIMPPSRIERPELWATLKFNMDAAGVIRLGDTVVDSGGIKKAIQKVFRDGKFPEVSLSTLPDAPFKKIEELLKELGAAGVTNVSFETSDK